ncbi:MAG TPA: hypothetical protein VLR91_07115 [Thermodesulfobacteriota bacterium]|nr:hypothetical protein [Thermodesulfobacteriota bacterium]
MNRHFLEFWGKALLRAAQSQKQLEDLAKWCQRGIFSFQDYTKIFKTSYGLDEVGEDSPDYFSIWNKAEENFQESFKEYLHIFGVVPREEYADLAREYEELKVKVAEQEETIKLLRLLLEEKGLGLAANSLEFQKLIAKQGDQFQKLIQGLGEVRNPEGHLV